MNRQTDNHTSIRRNDLKVFAILALFLAPALSVVSVASYGFAVWMYQLVAGPPAVSTASGVTSKKVTVPAADLQAE